MAWAGETLTDLRLLGPRLAAAATGIANARIVPVRLADGGVAELLRGGDRVDVVTTTEKANSGAAPNPRTLAVAASVVLVTQAAGGVRGSSDRIVLMALPNQQATTVAAASLTSALTVVLG